MKCSFFVGFNSSDFMEMFQCYFFVLLCSWCFFLFSSSLSFPVIAVQGLGCLPTRHQEALRQEQELSFLCKRGNPSGMQLDWHYESLIGRTCFKKTFAMV